MRLKMVKPCPTPSAVTGEDWALCNQRVHDLRRAPDPVAEAIRIGRGAGFCARVLVTALALEGCSGALDGLGEPVATPTAKPDAAAPDSAPADDDTFGLIMLDDEK